MIRCPRIGEDTRVEGSSSRAVVWDAHPVASINRMRLPLAALSVGWPRQRTDRSGARFPPECHIVTSNVTQ